MKIAPGVVMDGKVVYPEGWMWVLGFALAGCRWAEEEVARPHFDEKVKEYFKLKEIHGLEQDKAAYQKLLAETEAKIQRVRTNPESYFRAEQGLTPL